MQTPEGSKKAVKTIIERHGEDFFRDIAKKSQKSYMSKPKEERKPRGFASMTPERRSEVGRKGGSRSKNDKA